MGDGTFYERSADGHAAGSRRTGWLLNFFSTADWAAKRFAIQAQIQ